MVCIVIQYGFQPNNRHNWMARCDKKGFHGELVQEKATVMPKPPRNQAV